MKKYVHEEFARFFENPTRESLRDLLQRNFGETNQLDFKEEWPDATKIARHILAIGNTGGGCLIAGISQDNTCIVCKGLSELKDKANLQQEVQKYLPTQLEYELFDFSYTDSEYPSLIGKKFQVLIIEDKPRYIPFVCGSAGKDIEADVIYVRRGTSSVKANYDELQHIINRRLATDYSTQKEIDLERELAELKLIYKQIPADYIIHKNYNEHFMTDSGGFDFGEYMENDFENFITDLIGAKKLRIRVLLKMEDL